MSHYSSARFARRLSVQNAISWHTNLRKKDGTWTASDSKICQETFCAECHKLAHQSEKKRWHMDSQRQRDERTRRGEQSHIVVCGRASQFAGEAPPGLEL